MKLGWMTVTGPEAYVADALARLEVICDTYLSVATPVQVAAASIIETGAGVRASIAARVSGNLATLRTRLQSTPSVSLLEPEGGWCAVLQIPAIEPEESLVLRLLRDHHVIVYPGFFFDFPREAYLVVSLLPEPAVFDTGMRRLLSAIG
jgi:hypothetical protein